jgi:hypothetical protein
MEDAGLKVEDPMKPEKTRRPGWVPIVVVTVVVLAAVGGIVAYQWFLEPESELITATISVDFGNGTSLNKEISCDNNTPLGLLRTMAGEENVEESGGFVSSIMGVGSVDDVPELASTEERYWLFYVNGNMPMESAAVYEVVDGDVVEFRFETSPW